MQELIVLITLGIVLSSFKIIPATKSYEPIKPDRLKRGNKTLRSVRLLQELPRGLTAELRVLGPPEPHQEQCQGHHPAWDQVCAKQALGAHREICASAPQPNSKAFQSTPLLRAKTDGVAGLAGVRRVT